MKEASWEECMDSNLVIRITPDLRRADSLQMMSGDRLIALKKLVKEVNETNCNLVFENHYTSLLEIMQALVIKKGYKVLNHFCLGYYLRDVLKRSDLFMQFDDLRYKRNSITYYGKRMDFETCKKAIEKCKYVINEVKNIRVENKKG